MLKQLHIDSASEMNLTIASRFREIRSIHINSLLRQIIVENVKLIEVDFETSVRLIPFLGRFAQLQRVSFGGTGEDGQNVEGFFPAYGYFREEDDEEETGGDRERMRSVIDSLSAAFRVGALPKTLQISGLCCPRVTTFGVVNCETCLRACRSFPLESVVDFEFLGSSKD